MPAEAVTALAFGAAALALVALCVAALRRAPPPDPALRSEIAAQGERLNTALLGQTRALHRMLADQAQRHAEQEARTRQALAGELARQRGEVAAQLAEIRRTVDEQLHVAVERQLTRSFARVTEQFAAVQKAMGDVQAVTAQIGDLRRLFGNARARGGWGEAQAKALLDDILPAGGYLTNVRPRPDSAETVEFAILMPAAEGAPAPLLPLDAKFPAEDYDRLLLAAERGDAEAERAARRALGERLRAEAAKIAEKYIHPPVTTEFALLYLPTDGLFAEAARLPGLLDEIGRARRVVVLGPSLLPAMLRSIRLGHVTLALGRNAEAVRELLAATKGEMARMEALLAQLGRQASGLGQTIERAQARTRAVARRLRDAEALDGAGVAQGLQNSAEAGGAKAEGAEATDDEDRG